MNDIIDTIQAMEILDSRGNPTIRVHVVLADGTRASASVPSGASTGAHEAVELRDGDKARYQGKGVLKAVGHVNAIFAPLLKGLPASHQEEIDRAMIARDATPNKSALGANAMLGVSMAVARAAAQSAGEPLYEWLSKDGVSLLPMPMMNILNGGKHAQTRVDFQEFMVVPVGAPSCREAVRCGAEIFHALNQLLAKKGYATGVGDEGGFAPDLHSNDEACELIVAAITAAGYSPGRDVCIALDPAASSFAEGKDYVLSKSDSGIKTTQEMIDLYSGWSTRFPIVSIEDGLAEHDWDGFRALTSKLGKTVQIVGDDLYVTNTRFIERGIREHASNAVLIKLNQIGTVTETLEAIHLCQDAGWNAIISHRSGETEDTFIADLAVATGAGQIKTGSTCRSERTCKYNRLMEIEAELQSSARFKNPFSKRAK
ncbi:MAG: phosphopyruvate hydratase [bacterium]